ncbi:MAG: hypothetical protein ACTSR1_02655, partial [Candidatus Heimdallarchaeota archaeon]
MRKGPLIAAGILSLIGLIMITVGGIFYGQDPIITWGNWVLWFGLIFINIGLIVLVIAFIKKPEEKE